MNSKKFSTITSQYRDRILKTASELIQINSQSLHEGELAAYITSKMTELGYDKVETDKYGNVFGTVFGKGGGKSVMLNCHLDVVDEGDHQKWTYPPFSGKIADGFVWGRGASDTKGAMAIFLYIPMMLRELDMLPKGDIVVANVISEEIAGYGAMMHTRDHSMLTDYAIVGEATENNFGIGCRGRLCALINIKGKSCHASVPSKGRNPFDFLTLLLPELKKVEMSSDDVFGSSTMTVTKIECSENGTNIVPNEITVYIDYRQTGSDNEQTVINKIRAAIDRCEKLDGISADVRALYFPLTTYTGYEGMGFQGGLPFSVSPDADYIQQAKAAVEAATGREIKCTPMVYGADAGHYAAHGVKCILYSPAEIKYCHSYDERIDINLMEEAAVGTLAIVNALANNPAN